MSFQGLIRQSLQEKSKEFLFVVGAARSGTTLIFNYFNEYNNIYLLNEDNPFFERNWGRYATAYNAMWAEYGRQRQKGYHIPRMNGDDNYWFDCYLELKKRYQFAGSKFAFGPHGEDYWNNIDRNALNFFQEYFPDATCFLTVRRPLETIWSMTKMFPNEAPGSLVNSWIKTLQLQLLLFSNLGRARFILHHTINSDLLIQLSAGVGLPPLDKGGAFLKATEGQASYAPHDSEHGQQLLNTFPDIVRHQVIELEKAFAFLCKDLDCVSGKVKENVHASELERSLWQELESLRANPDYAFSLV